jgi:hypothetical protein
MLVTKIWNRLNLVLMKKETRNMVLVHLTGWLLFLLLPSLLVPPAELFPNLDLGKVLRFMQVSSIPLMGLFYTHLYFLLPRYYRSGRYLAYGIGIVLSLLAVFVLNGGMFLLLGVNGSMNHLEYFLPPATIRSFVILILSFLLFIYQQLQRSQAEKVQAELSYLKAQINPHFLFNTLNSIYFLALKKSESAPNAIEKLSAIMRYVIDEGSQDHVALNREVAYLKDYIALQKLRFAENVKLDLEIIGDIEGMQIAPLLLVSFVENAFKHGISMEQESPILIQLKVCSGHFQFLVRNNRFDRYVDSGMETGIGLENTRQRLALLYPSHHSLELRETPTHFEIEMNIQLV